MSTERTEEATPKRQADARRDGNVFRSQDFSAVLGIGFGLVFLLLAGPVVAAGFARQMADGFRGIALAAERPLLPSAAWLVQPQVWGPVLLLLLGVALASVAAGVLQVGFLLTGGPLEPKWTKVDPLAGLKRLFSLRRLVQSAQAAVKLVVVGFLAYLAARAVLDHPVLSRPVAVTELGAFLARALWEIGWRVLLALAGLAALDWLYQRWQYTKDLRMSRTEVKDEHRQTEGPVEARQRMKSIGRRRLFKSVRRMLEDVADATIVVTNPTHYAVALRYVRGETAAPVVVAKGRLRVAGRIRERALALGLPIVADPPLARGLHRHGQVGEPIPVLYYQAVAAVLAPFLRRGARLAGPPGAGEGGPDRT